PGFHVALRTWFEVLVGLAQPEPGAPAAPASNRSTLYQLDGDPAVDDAERQLNGSVARVDRDDAPSDTGRLPVPSLIGAPAVPVLTLHTVGDLFVPFSMQQAYARRAVVNGASGKVVQRAV